jgi:hypothetical protein
VPLLLADRCSVRPEGRGGGARSPVCRAGRARDHRGGRGTTPPVTSIAAVDLHRPGRVCSVQRRWRRCAIRAARSGASGQFRCGSRPGWRPGNATDDPSVSAAIAPHGGGGVPQDGRNAPSAHEDSGRHPLAGFRRRCLTMRTIVSDDTFPPVYQDAAPPRRLHGGRRPERHCVALRQKRPAPRWCGGPLADGTGLPVGDPGHGPVGEGSAVVRLPGISRRRIPRSRSGLRNALPRHESESGGGGPQDPARKRRNLSRRRPGEAPGCKKRIKPAPGPERQSAANTLVLRGFPVVAREGLEPSTSGL